MHPRSISRDTSQHSNFPSAFQTQSQNQAVIPSLPKELEKDQNLYFTYDTDSSAPPPLCTTNFFVTEKSNSSPHLIRSSMYTIPADPHLYSSINLPIFITLQPFSHKQEYNESSKAIFCNECFCYVNLFSKINKEANTFVCNICGIENKMSEEIKKVYATTDYTIRKYYNASEVDDTRLSSKKLPDDAMVDSSYFDNKLFPTAFLFVVQKNTQFFHTLKEIKKLVENEFFIEQFKKVCLIILSEEIEIYKFSNNKLSLDFLCDSNTFLTPSYFLSSKNILLAIEHALSEESIKSSTIDCDFLELVCLLSKYSIGSKSAIFIQNTATPPALSAASFIERLNENNHSLYIFSENLTGIEEIAIKTSGNVYKNIKDVKNLAAKSFFGVKISLKTSDAIRKSNIYANTTLENNIEVKLSSMDSQSVVTFSFYVDETCKENQSVYLQAIISYYNYLGDEKLLVLNQKLNSSFKAVNIFSEISFDVLFSGFCKLIINDFVNLKQNLTNVKKSIIKCLKFYRSFNKSANENQMVLPESMKLIPLLYSCLLKNNLILNTANPNTMALVTALSVERNLRFFYPKIFSLTEYFLENKIIQIQNSYKNIQSNEIYIIENGLQIFIYIGKDIEIDDNQLFEGEEGKLLNKILEDIQNEYDLQLEYKIIRQGKADFDVLSMFVEDKLNNIPAYSDYLCELHFSVKES